MEFRLVKRAAKFLGQRIFRGWDDSDTWSLDITIAEFILPRLKRFKACQGCYPCHFETREDWDAILDKMIFAFEKLADNTIPLLSEADERKVRHGLYYFAKYYRNLWW